MDVTELQNLLNKKSISKEDFKTGFKTVQNSGGYSSDSIFNSGYSDKEMDSLFSNFDVNGDGVIDKNDGLNNDSISDDVISENDLDLLVNKLNDLDVNVSDFGAALGTDNLSSSSSSGGGSYSAGGDNSLNASDGSAPTEESYSSMSSDELKTELNTANNELAEKQKAMNDITDGSNSTLKGLQDGIDAKEQEYQTALNEKAPELAKNYEAAKTDLDTHNQAIAETTVKISEKQSQVDTLTSEISSLEGQIQGYESSISALEAKEGSEDAPEDLSSRIQNLKAKKQAAQEEKDKKASELENANTELTKSQEELSALEGQTSKKEQTLQAIETQISALNDTQLSSLKTEVDTLKTDYQSQKETLKTTAQSEIDTAKEKVNKIQTEYDTKKTQEIKNEGTVINAKGLYDSLELQAQGLSFENFNFMYEGYQKLEDKGNGRVSVVDEKNHNCFVIDMNTKKLVGKYRVSTGHLQNNIDKANQAGSYRATPGGWLKIDGTHYGRRYSGNAMHLVGMEDCNNNTESRGVVGHHIGYGIGNNTWGCLGFKENVSVIQNEILRNGGRVFVIKEGMIGQDSKYRNQSKYYA